MHTCAHTLTQSSVFLEKGHTAKDKEEGWGQAEQHQEQSRAGPSRSEVTNGVLMETASAHAEHSLPVSPPTAPQTSSWQEDASLANTQLRHSCIWSSSCQGRGAGLQCFGLYIHLFAPGKGGNPEEQQRQSVPPKELNRPTGNPALPNRCPNTPTL